MKKFLLMSLILLGSISYNANGEVKDIEDYREDNTQVLIDFREDIVREMQRSYVAVGNDAYFWIDVLSRAKREDLVEEVNTDMTEYVTMVQQVEATKFTHEDVIKVSNLSKLLRLKWINAYRQYL